MLNPTEILSLRCENITLTTPQDTIESLFAKEETLLQYFCSEIFICFGIPYKDTSVFKHKYKWRTAATAVAYFRRFFLRRNLLQYDIRLMMLCSIFLAGKTEYNFIGLAELHRICDKYTEKDVLDGEIALLEGLNFELKVHHAQNVALALLTEIKSQLLKRLSVKGVSEAKDIAGKIINSWFPVCESMIYSIQTTYGPLCHSATSIAYCCISLTEPKELADLQIGKLNELILAEGKLNEEVLNNLSIDSKDIVPFIRQSQVQIDEKEIALSIHRLHEHNKWRSPPPLGGGSGGSSEGRQEQEVHMVDLSMTEETS